MLCDLLISVGGLSNCDVSLGLELLLFLQFYRLWFAAVCVLVCVVVVVVVVATGDKESIVTKIRLNLSVCAGIAGNSDELGDYQSTLKKQHPVLTVCDGRGVKTEVIPPYT